MKQFFVNQRTQQCNKATYGIEETIYKSYIWLGSISRIHKKTKHQQKLKEFGTTKSGLQEMLKELLLAEKITTRNIKIMKGKSTLVKANIQ